MPETMSPREKVARIVDPWAFSIVANIQHTERAADERTKALIKADAILASLASSGDHAELARLAEPFGPDEKWTASGNSVALSVDGLYACVAESNPEGAFSDDHAARIAAFIAAANPATVLALIAEVAALRGEAEKLDEVSEQCSRWIAAHDEQADRATEAERKLAEAVGLLLDFLPWSRKFPDLKGRIEAFLSKEAERG